LHAGVEGFAAVGEGELGESAERGQTSPADSGRNERASRNVDAWHLAQLLLERSARQAVLPLAPRAQRRDPKAVMQLHRQRKNHASNFASAVSRATGSSYGFVFAFSFVLLGLLTGPMFYFSRPWHAIISTATTIITFLMVFVIQQAQNKNTVAIQLKLNELISSNSSANNRLVDIEELSPEELQVVKKFYVKLARRTETATNVHAAHSLDEPASEHREHALPRSRDAT
jgi:low affinity Fe/Cu permease